MNEMKTIDFVGKLRGMNGPVIAADYVSVGGGYVENPSTIFQRPLLMRCMRFRRPSPLWLLWSLN